MARLPRNGRLADGARSCQPDAVTLARQAIALHHRLVLIDQIGEAGQRADRRGPAQRREDSVAADRLLPRADTVDAPDGTDAPGIGDVGLDALHRDDLGAHRIEGLAVVADRRRADEAFVVELDTLASGGDRQRGGAILQLRAIKGDVLRIGDLRAEGGGAVQSVIKAIDDREIALRLRQRRPWPFAHLQSGADAGGDGIGIVGQSVLFDMFVPQPRLDQRLDRLRGGRRRAEQGQERHGDDP